MTKKSMRDGTDVEGSRDVAIASEHQKAASSTPGPWQCQPLHGRSVIAGVGVFQLGSLGADVLARDMEANARLIAAAPDLLAALRLFVERYLRLVSSGDCGNWDAEGDDEMIAARAAIAKAEGR